MVRTLHDDKELIEPSSGNVFADLGFQDAEERLLKASRAIQKNMKKPIKTKKKRDARRNLFAELGEGMNALAEERVGKRTL